MGVRLGHDREVSIQFFVPKKILLHFLIPVIFTKYVCNLTFLILSHLMTKWIAIAMMIMMPRKENRSLAQGNRQLLIHRLTKKSKLLAAYLK